MLEKLIAAFKQLRDGLLAGDIGLIGRGVLAILTVLLSQEPQPLFASASPAQKSELKALHDECQALAEKQPVADADPVGFGGLVFSLLSFLLPLILKFLK